MCVLVLDSECPGTIKCPTSAQILISLKWITKSIDPRCSSKFEIRNSKSWIDRAIQYSRNLGYYAWPKRPYSDSCYNIISHDQIWSKTTVFGCNRMGTMKCLCAYLSTVRLCFSWFLYYCIVCTDSSYQCFHFVYASLHRVNRVTSRVIRCGNLPFRCSQFLLRQFEIRSLPFHGAHPIALKKKLFWSKFRYR